MSEFIEVDKEELTKRLSSGELLPTVDRATNKVVFIHRDGYYTSIDKTGRLDSSVEPEE